MSLIALCLYVTAKVEGNWHGRYQAAQSAERHVQSPPSAEGEDTPEQKGEDTMQRDERTEAKVDSKPVNSKAGSNLQPVRPSGSHKEKPVQSATDIANQVMRGQGAGFVEGIAALYQMKREAGMEERMLEQVERKMNVRQRLAHGVAKTITAEDGVPEAVHRAQMNAIRRERELEEARNPPPPGPPVSERRTWTPPPPRPAWMPNADSDMKRVAREVCVEICKDQDPQAAWENFCYDINKHEMPPRLREELEDLVRERLQALDVL